MQKSNENTKWNKLCLGKGSKKWNKQAKLSFWRDCHDYTLRLFFFLSYLMADVIWVNSQVDHTFPLINADLKTRLKERSDLAYDGKLWEKIPYISTEETWNGWSLFKSDFLRSLSQSMVQCTCSLYRQAPPALQFFFRKLRNSWDFNISKHMFTVWTGLNSVVPAAIAFVNCMMWHTQLKMNVSDRYCLVCFLMTIYWTLA